LSTAAERCQPTPADLAGTAGRISAAIESVIHGKPGAVRLILTVLIAAGHVLIEDVPGVGKTMLAKALGRATATRGHPELCLGASPRATLHLARASRSYAALDARGRGSRSG